MRLKSVQAFRVQLLICDRSSKPLLHPSWQQVQQQLLIHPHASPQRAVPRHRHRPSIHLLRSNSYTYQDIYFCKHSICKFSTRLKQRGLSSSSSWHKKSHVQGLGTSLAIKMTKGFNRCSAMPPIHQAAYQGDLPALVQCIQDGDNVNATIDLPNEQHHRVCGVTPLYLAAQAGHKQACILLVQAGADVLRTCAVPETGDVFGPADIALVHFNVSSWLYLQGVKKQRLGKMSSRAAFKGSQMAEPLIGTDDALLV